MSCNAARSDPCMRQLHSPSWARIPSTGWGPVCLQCPHVAVCTRLRGVYFVFVFVCVSKVGNWPHWAQVYIVPRTGLVTGSPQNILCLYLYLYFGQRSGCSGGSSNVTQILALSQRGGKSLVTSNTARVPRVPLTIWRKCRCGSAMSIAPAVVAAAAALQTL